VNAVCVPGMTHNNCCERPTYRREGVDHPRSRRRERRPPSARSPIRSYDCWMVWFAPEHRQELERIVTARDGLFLVAGPTGSGKTTTLYACLQLLASTGLKVVSVEDPVEYHFNHVVQVQTNEAAGVDFPTALRSFLRHDPDVIFVGEIRDRETAQVAVQAALTGHLVVASIHAVDAPRVIARLIDMGVDKYQLDAALRATDVPEIGPRAVRMRRAGRD